MINGTLLDHERGLMHDGELNLSVHHKTAKDWTGRPYA
jgi:hypothetical protein